MHHRTLIRGESGFALPTAMFFILGMLAILSIGAVAALSTQRGTVRDASSKSALAIAESGAEAALLRYGRGRHVISNTTRCLSPGVDAAGQPIMVPEEPMGAEDDVELPAGSDQAEWCRPVVEEIEHGTYRYWVRPLSWSEEGVDIEIISEGFVDSPTTDGDAMRRIRLFAHAETLCDPDCPNAPGGEEPGDPPEEEEDPPEESPPGPSTGFIGTDLVVGINSLSLEGNAEIHGGAGSNGQVTFNGNAELCGPLRIGPGTESPVGNNKNVKNPAERPFRGPGNSGICYPPGYPVTMGTEVYPPVVPPADIATNNSNGRLSGADPANGSGVKWNSATRRLEVKGNSELRLRGTAPYFLCDLEVAGNAELYAEAPGQPVSIFIDSPEHCSGNPSTQLTISGNSEIHTNGHMLGIFMVGSDWRATYADLAGNGDVAPIVLYAPKTDIDIPGNFDFRGAVIGKTLDITGNAEAFSFDGTTYPIPVEVADDDDGDDGDGGDQSDPGDGGEGEMGEHLLTIEGGFNRSGYVECPAVAVPDDSFTDPGFNCDTE